MGGGLGGSHGGGGALGGAGEGGGRGASAPQATCTLWKTAKRSSRSTRTALGLGSTRCPIPPDNGLELPSFKASDARVRIRTHIIRALVYTKGQRAYSSLCHSVSIAINTRLYVHLATVFKPLDCSVWWSGLVPSVAAASDPLWGAGAAATRGHEEPKNQARHRMAEQWTHLPEYVVRGVGHGAAAMEERLIGDVPD
eukprot:461549-Prorocentrum_minimum.AAC.1